MAQRGVKNGYTFDEFGESRRAARSAEIRSHREQDSLCDSCYFAREEVVPC